MSDNILKPILKCKGLSEDENSLQTAKCFADLQPGLLKTANCQTCCVKWRNDHVNIQNAMQYCSSFDNLPSFSIVQKTGKRNTIDTKSVFSACRSVFHKTEIKELNTISLKNSRPKVLLPSVDILPHSVEDINSKKCNVTFKETFTMNESFPQQVSEEQEGAGRSEFAFSNGMSIAFASDRASRLPVEEGGNEVPRINGHINGNFSEYNEHNIYQRTEGHSSLMLNGLANTSTVSAPPRYPEYVEYNDRLRTYARWIRRRPDTHALTSAGFFYTNSVDLVRCYQCGIGLKDFSEDDDPLREHVRHSGNCSYLKQLLGETQLTTLKRQLQSEDPEYNRQMQWNERHTVNRQTYRHPEYQTLQARMSSFANWPTHMIQRPTQLAEAGLYYTGFEDRVRCFACDGGLQKWDPDDDPWTEHCRWFPACSYARELKGDEFIALIQAAVASENHESESQINTSRQGNHGLQGAFEHMSLRDPEFKAALDEHKETCLEMGYQLLDFNEAVQELRNRGSIKPTIEEVIDAIEIIKERRQQDSVLKSRQNETPMEENQRLKNLVLCMLCGRNSVNALFLPCTHHRLCMQCAESISNCPVCDKYIRKKIRTYMA